MSEKAPNIGDKIETWFSGAPDGMSTVLAVYPYRGRYPEYFKYVVKATALNTKRGWIEFAL